MKLELSGLKGVALGKKAYSILKELHDSMKLGLFISKHGNLFSEWIMDYINNCPDATLADIEYLSRNTGLNKYDNCHFSYPSLFSDKKHAVLESHFIDDGNPDYLNIFIFETPKGLKYFTMESYQAIAGVLKTPSETLVLAGSDDIGSDIGSDLEFVSLDEQSGNFKSILYKRNFYSLRRESISIRDIFNDGNVGIELNRRVIETPNNCCDCPLPAVYIWDGKDITEDTCRHKEYVITAYKNYLEFIKKKIRLSAKGSGYELNEYSGNNLERKLHTAKKIICRYNNGAIFWDKNLESLYEEFKTSNPASF